MDQLKGSSQPRTPVTRRDSQTKLSYSNPIHANSKPKAEDANSKPKAEVNVESLQTELIQKLIGGEQLLDLEKYKDVLLNQDEYDRNLLHRIILRLKKLGGEHAHSTSEEILDAIDRIVIEGPQLLIQEDLNNSIPLLEAAESKVAILFRVINLSITDPTWSVLKSPCDDSNKMCPLRNIALNGRLVEKFRGGKIRKQHGLDQSGAPGISKPTVDKPNQTDTCLHSQLDLKRLHEWDGRLKSALTKGLSMETRTRWTCLQTLIRAKNFDTAANGSHAPATATIPLEGFRTLLKLCPNKLFVNLAKGITPLQTAIQLYSVSTVDYNHLTLVVKELVHRSPSSIYFEAGDEAAKNKGKTAYRLLKEVSENDENKDAIKAAAEILKMACIGLSPTESDLEKKLRFLYWDDPTRMRKIGLNLNSENAKIDKEYISTMSERSGMDFESVLASVKLPYWNPEDRDAHFSPRAHLHSNNSGIRYAESEDPYVDIFKWLRKCEVRKIYVVDIDDTGPVPHSNDAIRQSLKRTCPEESSNSPYNDFEVEIFKWKKYDLCSHTICAAVPSAKEVHLYSSGNTAILRAWACSSGFHTMERLERLHVEIYPSNKNDEADCRSYENEFRNILAGKCRSLAQDSIQIKYPNSDSEVNNAYGSGQQNPESTDPNQHSPPDEGPNEGDWLQRMEPFKKFVRALSQKVPEKSRPKVKVAVLDDGASLSSLTSQGLNGGKGETFRVDNVEYCVGPCPHGTQMVECIRKLCPDAELYVARLDDSGVAEPKQPFTTESCYRALAWARKMKVDIISMSWSFHKKKPREDPSGDDFVAELNKAVADKNVILFASLPDKGATATITEYTPVGEKEIIRIGSATMYGEEAKENIFAPRDFLLPGEEIKTTTGESDKGSSYATAYAAGLAALVLQCLRTHQALEEHHNEEGTALAHNYDDEILNNRVKEAATMDGMRKILKVLSNEPANAEIPKKGLFIRPYRVLKYDFAVDDGMKMIQLREIGPKILPSD